MSFGSRQRCKSHTTVVPQNVGHENGFGEEVAKLVFDSRLGKSEKTIMTTSVKMAVHLLFFEMQGITILALHI